MAKKIDTTRELKIYAGIGIAALVLGLVIPSLLLIYGLNYRPPQELTGQLPQAQPKLVGRLGELGSTCGGKELWPCRPGLQCSNGHAYQSYGTCVKAEASSSTAALPELKQLGEDCAKDTTACAPGLYCKQSSCARFEDQAPRILQMTLEGMQPTAGKYLAKPATTVTVRLQAVNAKEIKISYQPADGSSSRDIAPVKNEKGGKYSAVFKVDSGMDGLITARATADNGDFSALSLGVAASQ